MNEVKEVQAAQENPTPVYQAPRVEDLGAWQAVTLFNSVPINPGGVFNLTGMGNSDGS